MTQTRKDLLDGLAALAKWCETCPEDMLPTVRAELPVGAESPAIAAGYVRAMGAVKKSYSQSVFTLTRRFSPSVEARALFWRSTVCTARVVGTRIIPAQAERVVEELEWTCEPLLAETSVVTQ